MVPRRALPEKASFTKNSRTFCPSFHQSLKNKSPTTHRDVLGSPEVHGNTLGGAAEMLLKQHFNPSGSEGATADINLYISALLVRSNCLSRHRPQSHRQGHKSHLFMFQTRLKGRPEKVDPHSSGNVANNSSHSHHISIDCFIVALLLWLLVL